MSSVVLEIQGLTKQVGKNKKIVHDASFQMKKGEILGLLGPNGAGKTTTIRMIVGLIKKTEGKVFINGSDLDREGQSCISDVGAIVENPSFYDHMSGYKNLQQYARLSKEKVSKERLDEVVALVQLSHAIKDKVKKYSLGMKQRLGVAQAILHKPALLILDEPTNGLDPKGIRELRDYLRELANDGISTLVSSHLLSEMQLMCDRVVIMEQGKIIDVSDMSSLNENGSSDQLVVMMNVKKEHMELSEEVIESLEGITIIKRENDHQLVLDMTHDLIPQLNRHLVKADVDVYGIESKKTSLEDKFLALTSEDRQLMKEGK
ncbi:bacitracin ABC transporter ATP-binding protein [Salipaludibacillus keqinensis]|uniref:Bacitracin ABC transporter ATP-binding protein n=1 Tax=Salipaludibacillus keqinensis TaxID=2045207 RepID=A0A323TBV7_9BACI|nr:ABC transporter ATP-binding protein [Salipaludibacillus keqinensis]PYZ92266.1 bacitracin ABC transporter ATP-binding protein [Salipaludibacillus keqinensis]